ncbi:response regulator transcription factor [Pelagibacterium limicola]|uniref:response regulator transcription factor n=1 Tax=Pelagibacterium limicola TaxID=2791022 RepID=UPI0018AFEC9F|nr:response regulator transcription factor [Pelagibacterium limicola]
MKMLIVEDDSLHRAYLRDTIAAALPECTEVIEAADGLVGEQLAREHKALHIVMDLQMNARTGIEAARNIWRERPETCILFWSNYSDEAYVRGVSRIVPEGAAYGYVLKSATDARLKLALRGIFVEGQCVIDREVRGVQQKSLGHRGGFTESEYEVLVDIALGLTDRAIAHRRSLSLRSVQNRLQQLYDKLELYKDEPEGQQPSTFNLRTRAISVALLRKLLNANSLEQAELELSEWRARHQ